MGMDRFCDIKQKEVINIYDGRCIGHVFDLVIDCHTGTICAIVVPGCSRWRSYFFGGEDIVIPWNRVIKMGEDVILVELDGPPIR
ncbi:YlmC/YmxH family sporulation protein [Eubacteriales bacterium OttesenSCG-928-M02]|nr:YlmC/YmxH family sporulation protein [Eubacteriales bacterium OttesenSCG-928-M02]